MMMLLLHESTGPHVHAGSAALSLWELAGLTIFVVAAYALLRVARRTRSSNPVTREN